MILNENSFSYCFLELTKASFECSKKQYRKTLQKIFRSVKKFHPILLITIFTLSACTSKQEKVVRLAHTLPTDHPVHQALVSFNEELQKLSKNSMRIDLYPSGQLGNERQVLELLQIGSISITKVSAATLANFIEEYEIFGTPYLFESDSQMFANLNNKLGESLLALGEDKRLKGLCFYNAGARSFYTTSTPINSPKDVKGKKIRVMNHKNSTQMVNHLGGLATPMAYSELYAALAQKVVDGAENNIPSFYSSKHYEICKHYSFDEHLRIPDVLVVSTTFLNTLSKQEQSWLYKAAKKSSEKQKVLWADYRSKALVSLKEQGVKFTYPKQILFKDKTDEITKRLKEKPHLKDLFYLLK